MRRLLPPLLLVALTLSGCGDAAPAESANRFSAEVRENFLDSCLERAKETARLTRWSTECAEQATR